MCVCNHSVDYRQVRWPARPCRARTLVRMKSSPRPSYWRSSCRTAEAMWMTTFLSTCRQALIIPAVAITMMLCPDYTRTRCHTLRQAATVNPMVRKCAAWSWCCVWQMLACLARLMCNVCVQPSNQQPHVRNRIAYIKWQVNVGASTSFC